MTYVSCFYHAFSGAQKVSWGESTPGCCGWRLARAILLMSPLSVCVWGPGQAEGHHGLRTDLVRQVSCDRGLQCHH